MLSTFSTVAGDQAGSLEDLAARGLLHKTIPVVEQLDKCATDLARLASVAHDRNFSEAGGACRRPRAAST
jgi:hypothetical protein